MKLYKKEYIEDIEEYYDITIPETHTYVLGNGCVVHNCGTGVGFSAERKFINNLPTVQHKNPDEPKELIVFEDSKLGWAKGYDKVLNCLWSGIDFECDYSKIRPRGARLKTFGGRACLTGDTIVYKDRKKSQDYNEITIGDLYDMKVTGKRKFHKNSTQCGYAHINKIKLRSLDETAGTFTRNKLVDVIDNGEAEVYEIETESGYKIKATANHRFMNDCGEWQYLSNFKKGCYIAVNGSKEKRTGNCIDCGVSITRRAIRCKSCYDISQQKDDCLATTVRQRKECQMHKESFCELCKHDGSQSKLQVHHKDGNPWNNERDNLQTLCEKCHRIEDTKRLTFEKPYSHKYLSYDKIKSINFVGIERVFDLSMEAPNHNFVANGFVSHNSGPAPLKSLIEFTTEIIEQNRDYKLQAIDIHDICCKIADTVVVGGVRRSALLSLSDLTDNQMAHAKTGEFWNTNPQRQMANNSVAYTRKPDVISFMNEWKNLIKSNSGERGIFNRIAAQKKANENHRRDGSQVVGINPCAEIILRSRQLCNLTEVIVRPEDDFNSLKKKIKIATMMGTWQAALTNFKFVNKKWKQNCDEECLLGVSLSGLRDHKILGSVNDTAKKWLGDFKHIAVATNKKVAERLGINRAAAITTLKPSGTVSVLVDCAPGAHVRQTSTGYYIRRVRISATDPLYMMLRDQGMLMHCEVGQTPENASTWVIEFPCKAPQEARTKVGQTAQEQLEYWKMLREFYTEHNPSITISVREEEWLETAAWVYKNFDNIGGLSFLPAADYVYQLAPFEDIDKATYDKMVEEVNKIDFSKLSDYEKEDQTIGSQVLACSGDSCELR